MTLRKYIIKNLLLFLSLYLIFFSSILNLSAKEINWIEVAKVGNEKQLIDSSSIKYNKGLLSVTTKNSMIIAKDEERLKISSYLLAIDCKKRLFSKLPPNTDINQVKTWTKPTNDKLMKITIINSCSY